MDIRKYSDDFFTIGNIAILQRTTGNGRYDFNFRMPLSASRLFLKLMRQFFCILELLRTTQELKQLLKNWE